jgi:hypothetical protein
LKSGLQPDGRYIIPKSPIQGVELAEIKLIQSLSSVGLSLDAIANITQFNTETCERVLLELPALDKSYPMPDVVNLCIPALALLSLRRLGAIIESGSNKDAMAAIQLSITLSEKVSALDRQGTASAAARSISNGW